MVQCMVILYMTKIWSTRFMQFDDGTIWSAWNHAILIMTAYDAPVFAWKGKPRFEIVRVSFISCKLKPLIFRMYTSSYFVLTGTNAIRLGDTKIVLCRLDSVMQLRNGSFRKSSYFDTDWQLSMINRIMHLTASVFAFIHTVMNAIEAVELLKHHAKKFAVPKFVTKICIPN